MKVIMNLYIFPLLPSPIYVFSSESFCKKLQNPLPLFLRLPFASPDLPPHWDLCHPSVLIKQTAPPTRPLPPSPVHCLASRLRRPTCLPPAHPPSFCFPSRLATCHPLESSAVSTASPPSPQAAPPSPSLPTPPALFPQILAAYKALMERLLSMLGAHNATQKSKEIIQLETRLASVSRTFPVMCASARACVL